MDEITLVLENIEYKLKKLLERKEKLAHRIDELENDNKTLREQISKINGKNAQLREELIVVKSAKSLDGVDRSMAKQKINELLREIEKSTVLLNK